MDVQADPGSYVWCLVLVERSRCVLIAIVENASPLRPRRLACQTSIDVSLHHVFEYTGSSQAPSWS